MMQSIPREIGIIQKGRRMEILFNQIDIYLKEDDPENSYIPVNRESIKLYFIQEGMRGPIKIGLSKDPQERLKALQTGNSKKLRMLWYIEPKTLEVESILHKAFDEHRICGEWFYPNGDLLNLILETICHSFDGTIYETNKFMFDLGGEK